MSITPLGGDNVHAQAQFKNTLHQIDAAAAEHQIGIQGYVHRNGCESRIFNPFNISMDTLDELMVSEWTGAAFDFYFHRHHYTPCPHAAIIARGVYAITLQSEEANATSCVVRSVQINQTDGKLSAITMRHTVEFTYVPDRRTTRLDTKVSNSFTLVSLSELDRTLNDFLSLVSLGITQMLIP